MISYIARPHEETRTVIDFKTCIKETSKKLTFTEAGRPTRPLPNTAERGVGVLGFACRVGNTYNRAPKEKYPNHKP